jgi:flagellar basal-body rod modification protein FlgD
MAHIAAISQGRNSILQKSDFLKPSEQEMNDRKGLYESRLSAEDLNKNRNLADEVNKTIRARGKKYGEALGKDDFMKILVTELRHQDPTQPMADREFIAQMTQFSSLEQMQNINSSMSSLNMKARYGEAYAMIGKQIEAFNPLTNIRTEGEVTQVIRAKDDVRLMVNGKEISVDDVHAVFPGQQNKESVHDKDLSSNKTSADMNMKITPSTALDNEHKAHAIRAYGAHDVMPAQHEIAKSVNQE